MKLPILLFFLVLPQLAFGQSKSAYSIPVHLIESHIGFTCNNVKDCVPCKSTQDITAQIEGKKYQLESQTLLPKGIVALGDYTAKLADHKEKPTGEFTRSYDLMFPDGSTRTFEVIGELE